MQKQSTPNEINFLKNESQEYLLTHCILVLIHAIYEQGIVFIGKLTKVISEEFKINQNDHANCAAHQLLSVPISLSHRLIGL